MNIIIITKVSVIIIIAIIQNNNNNNNNHNNNNNNSITTAHVIKLQVKVWRPNGSAVKSTSEIYWDLPLQMNP